MIIYGKGLFGKVDSVRGVFYVATNFLHIFYVPVVPWGSWLVFDDSPGLRVFDSSWRGIPLGRVGWKSIGMAWLRGALCVLTGGAAFVGVTTVAAVSLSKGAPYLGLALLSALVVGFTYRLGRATPASLTALAEVQELPPELLEEARAIVDDSPASRRARAAPSQTFSELE